MPHPALDATSETSCYKLTPSMLAYLWDDCRRCFWLKARRGVHRPRMPMPSVFTKYHGILSRHFLGTRTDALTPALPAGRCLATEAWVQSEPLALPGCDATCYLLGRLDHLMRFDSESWGIIDYKTVEPKAAQVAAYGRQLHAYAWALERAKPGALCLTPVTRLGLLCLDPMRIVQFTPGAQALVALQPTWVEVPRQDAAFERFLVEVVRCVAEDEAPAASPACPCCRYHARRQEVESSYVDERPSP